ncbi:MAG TPA: GvpL/GvpF family gas vesicle protein, partial [Longimicrobium sp.]|nr:GvpL/GvpF family gas vesicle protein [Longimicrobium sp.]
HWEVHRALLREDIVPAPAGVVFADHEGVRAFLTESHASLTGALERVAGRWEFRLHVDVVDTAFSRDLALDLSTHIYAELRRISAAAVTLPNTRGRVMSAAFLVDRAASSAFQDRLEVLARLNSALGLDLTGPWPPYDFVAMG